MWSRVQRGNVEVLTTPAAASKTLMLCYPPPDMEMAYEAVTAYTGETVALIGEFNGNHCLCVA